jgi:hypothetical protein
MSLRVKLLLIRLHVDVALQLSTGCAELESELTNLSTVVHTRQAGHATVLKRVLEAGSKVRNELLDRSSVSHGTRNTLSDQNAVTLREVTSSSSVALLAVLATVAGLLVLHGVDAAHASVSLDKLTLARDERSTGRLGGTSQETTHHDGRGTKGKTLDDVTNVLDTTVSDTRNAKASSESADTVDSSSLGTADSHNLLGDTGRTTTHTDSETINTSSDQRSSLLSGHDVSANDIDVRELLLNPLDHLDLVHTVTLGAVQDNDVETGLNELLETKLVLRASTNSSSTEELLAIGKLGGIREMLVLGQIGTRDHRNEVGVLVDDRELALLGLGKDLVGFEESDGLRSSDKVLNHDIGDRLVKVLLELKVSVGNNTNKLGAKLAILWSFQLAYYSCAGQCDHEKLM